VIEFILDNLLLVAVVLVSGGLLAWPLIADKTMGPVVDNDQAIEYINRKNAFVLDVRSPKEFKRGAIAGSKNIPFENFEARLEECPKDRPIIVVDTVHTFSHKAATLLRKKGYKDVFVLTDGIKGWVDARLPFTR